MFGLVVRLALEVVFATPTTRPPFDLLPPGETVIECHLPQLLLCLNDAINTCLYRGGSVIAEM